MRVSLISFIGVSFTVCIFPGTVISPGSTQLRAKDIKSRLLASKATCIITDPESAEFVDEVKSSFNN